MNQCELAQQLPQQQQRQPRPNQTQPPARHRHGAHCDQALHQGAGAKAKEERPAAGWSNQRAALPQIPAV